MLPVVDKIFIGADYKNVLISIFHFFKAIAFKEYLIILAKYLLLTKINYYEKKQLF